MGGTPSSVVLCLVAQSCLQPARLLCLWGFSRQEYWSGLPCPSLGDLTTPGIKPRSLSLPADSLPSESPGKPKNTGVGSLSLLQGNFRPRDQTRVSYIAGGFFTSWVTQEALLPLLINSYCPCQSRSLLLDLVPLWGDQFLQSQNLLSSFCWLWGNAGPLASQEWGGGPRTASPSVGIASPYHPQESGACYLPRLRRALLGEPAFIQHLDLFPPLCNVLWDSCPYLSSPKTMSPGWAHIASSPAASPLLCLCKDISVSLQINPYVQLVMFNFLEVVKKQFIFWNSWAFGMVRGVVLVWLLVLCMCVLSCSVKSNSLWPYGL